MAVPTQKVPVRHQIIRCRTTNLIGLIEIIWLFFERRVTDVLMVEFLNAPDITAKMAHAIAFFCDLHRRAS